MKNQYIELARQASVLEQQGEWEEASKHWLETMKFASDADRSWAYARFEFCCKRMGTEPLSFLNTEKKWFELLSK